MTGAGHWPFSAKVVSGVKLRFMVCSGICKSGSSGSGCLSQARISGNKLHKKLPSLGLSSSFLSGSPSVLGLASLPVWPLVWLPVWPSVWVFVCGLVWPLELGEPDGLD